MPGNERARACALERNYFRQSKHAFPAALVLLYHVHIQSSRTKTHSRNNYNINRVRDLNFSSIEIVSFPSFANLILWLRVCVWWNVRISPLFANCRVNAALRWLHTLRLSVRNNCANGIAQGSLNVWRTIWGLRKREARLVLSRLRHRKNACASLFIFIFHRRETKFYTTISWLFVIITSTA